MIFHPPERPSLESICHYIAKEAAFHCTIYKVVLVEYIRLPLPLHPRSHQSLSQARTQIQIQKHKYKKQKYTNTNTLDSTFAITSAPTSISVTSRTNCTYILQFGQINFAQYTCICKKILQFGQFRRMHFAI